jgi:hypothetical protein
MSGWYAIVWCPDCTGQDPMGCFDGGTETHGPFQTEQEARTAGDKAIHDSIYRYDIEQRPA